MKHPCLSIRDISLEWNEALRARTPPPLWRLGDWVDDFRTRAATAEAKRALVLAEPVWVDTPGHDDCNAYWAAMAETLCREAGLTPPEWTESPRCFLSRPWFAGALENLKAILLAESPVAFRRRNLFVSADALSRV